ncbi:ACP receptor [Tribolium castaneum]|uniref:ACP receptor n=2 Tax=Tribolium castaneum TaxID=7070 RepID=D5FFV2_TRICA|nr:ACP receptor [Tribolium castaneum]ABX52400.1 ACP receptor [Tribolium castaneum]|eukprot:NP_001280549.1 ACP receptor [Tribolium castaneum]
MQAVGKMGEEHYDEDSKSNFSVLNETLDGFANETVSPDVLFQQNLTVILVYSALFVVAAVGNLTVFISLFRSRHRKSRISLMIRHLAIADLIVTFIMIPIEVGWRLTGKWIAGNVACKVFLFLRAFGPYLSSNVLVCVSLDRYFAVLHPLRVNDARRRGKIMLAFAWGTSFVYCIPQSFVFRVRAHPKYPNYEQCVSFGFFENTAQEIAYNLMCVMCMYFIPLFVIIVAYTAIMCEISKNSKETKGESYRTSNGRMRLRRSDISNIERARSRTLRMTITIVAVYVWCCTPYVIITMWYMFDRASATSLPEWLQDTFFMMVVSNSCMNPIVYGSYVINFQRVNCNCFCFRKTASESHLNVGSGATRSTAMVHGAGGNGYTRSPTPKSNLNLTGLLSKSRLPDKPPSVGHISFLSEPRTARNYRSSFHSEPCSRTRMCPDELCLDTSCHSADYYSSAVL